MFVIIVPEEKTAVRRTEGVVNFVYNDGKPALVKEKEIKVFKKLLDAGISREESGKNRQASHMVATENNWQHETFQFYFNAFNSRLIPPVNSAKLI